MRSEISKGRRFEILKRDGFTCQYCGRRPPVVILHVDHILALANGGDSEDDNLVTACQDCNLGKGVKRLDRVLIALPKAEEIKEREEQLAAYQALLIERKKRVELDVQFLGELWARLEGQPVDGDSFMLPVGLIDSIRKFVGLLPRQEIEEAMGLAFERINGSDQNRVRYFYGVCWHKVRGERPMDAYKKEG